MKSSVLDKLQMACRKRHGASEIIRVIEKPRIEAKVLKFNPDKMTMFFKSKYASK